MDEKKLSQKNADTVISLSSLTDTEIQVDRGRREGQYRGEGSKRYRLVGIK